MKTAEHTDTRSSSRLFVTTAVVIGSLVSLSIGVYSRYHEPTGAAIFKLGFPTMLEMKVWLATGAGALAVVQLISALCMYGKLPWAAGSRVALAHRWSGTFAFVLTLPVAFHCLWSLGFHDQTARVLNHSLLGCVFYGVFTTKMFLLRARDTKRWLIPLAGGLLFAILIAIWLTSALWYFQTFS